MTRPYNRLMHKSKQSGIPHKDAIFPKLYKILALHKRIMTEELEENKVYELMEEAVMTMELITKAIERQSYI